MGKNIISNYFKVSTGLKQGCQLSPMLVSVFINDLENELNGRVYVAGHYIKILLYAGDAVILPHHPGTLQKMINRFQTYFETWNLTVNLNK